MLRVAPKAASNRYPYLFSSCNRAQISLPYIQMRQHIILGIVEGTKAASNRYPYLLYSCGRVQILCSSAYVYTIFVVYRW